MLKNGLEGRIKTRVNLLKSGKAKKYFCSHIGYPRIQRDIDKSDIQKRLKPIEDIFPELTSLLKSVRPHIKHIWDEDKITASYLLLGKAFKTLSAVIAEVKKGNVVSVVELSRTGCEAIDLASLFLSNEGEPHLKKWFKGKIISNIESRKVLDKQVREMLEPVGLSTPLEKMKNDIYWIYSLYIHSGYSAILDLVDVFYEDFDYYNYSGYHYSKQYLHLVENLLVNLLLGFKNLFSVVGDSKGLTTVEKMLQQFQSLFATPKEVSNWVFPLNRRRNRL